MPPHTLSSEISTPNMKIIIQIPCYNEEASLPDTYQYLPKSILGFEVVEYLIIDDGSTDRTCEVARSLGIHHIVQLAQHQGLAKGFMAGIDRCLELGADVIVNTDADNQYNADDIPALVAPILQGNAEIVIGTRPTQTIEHFSPIKKFLQKLGSRVVRATSRTDVQDAPSGFRAISRTAAMQLNVFSEYTYTLETIIQCGQNGIKIASVPIRVNGETRPSRLVKNIWSYVYRSIITIFRIFIIYRPMQFFASAAFGLLLIGFLLGLRYLYFIFTGDGSGHIQSVILSAFLMGSGFLLAMIAIIVDLIAVNRRLLEKLNYRMLRVESKLQPNESIH